LQLAAAGWLLYVIAGSVIGAVVARNDSQPPWRLLLAFAAGYSITLLVLMPVGVTGHSIALFATASTCISLLTPYDR
jgi:hypothetical protein